jgi:hypothetical protein
MGRRSNRKKLREAKQRAWDASVSREAKLHPITVVRRVPAPPPVESALSILSNLKMDERRDVQELSPRPDHRVIKRYVQPTAWAARAMILGGREVSEMMHQRTVIFQAMQYGLRVDATDFVWWNWVPQNEALASKVAYGLRRAMSLTEQMKEMIASSQIEIYGRWPSAREEFMGFLDVVLEDCAQNLGQP